MSGNGGEGEPAADALGEEGVAVAGSSATTWCGWPKSSNETTPKRFVHTIMKREHRSLTRAVVAGRF